MLSWSIQDYELSISINKDRIKYLNEKDEVRHNLTLEQRKRIFNEIQEEFLKNEILVDKKYPVDFENHLPIGKTYRLLGTVPISLKLHAGEKLENIDSSELFARLRQLPAGFRITLNGTATTSNGEMFYYVTARGKGITVRGWIKPTALVHKIAPLTQENRVKYMNERQEKLKELDQKAEENIARKYGLTLEVLKDILNEGIVKNWPLPPREGCWKNF